MTSQRQKALALDAMKTALQVRREAGYQIEQPACPYSIAETLGLSVRFVEIPSFEGLYISGKRPSALISSQRPPGRQAMTCAHEIGHHTYQHGEQYDELMDSRSPQRRVSEPEFLADRFAEFLLMPKTTVEYAFAIRNWSINDTESEKFYIISAWLGVGYKALINHLRFGLKLIDAHLANELSRCQPIKIRSAILGERCASNLIVADNNWVNRTIDVRVGDYVVVPENSMFDDGLVTQRGKLRGMLLLQAKSAGIGEVVCDESSWSNTVRVQPAGFVGLAKYRFEDVTDDE